jgi:NHS family xanthosine MFS transporter
MFLGGALQLTNMYGDTYLSEFANIPNIQTLCSQIFNDNNVNFSSFETLFILAIPFFLKRFGIKQVIISMFA